MKPPVKISDLHDMWAVDSKVDVTEPSRELARIGQLHSKYLHILSFHNLLCKKLTSDYNKHKRFKIEYYSGYYNNPEDLKKFNIQPILKKIHKDEIPMHVDSDNDICDILLKKALNQEIVDVCSHIIKEIGQRTWQLGNIVKWEMFTGGKS
jgi:hypothetical protein